MKKLLAFSALALVCATAQAVEDDRFYITPFVNYTFFDEGLDDEVGFSINIGKPITESLNLELSYSLTEPQITTSGADAEVQSIDATVDYFYDRSLPVYLLGSVGYAEVEGPTPTGIAKADGLQVGLGVGAFQTFTDYGLAVVAEYRYLFRDLEGNNNAGAEANDHVVSLGLRVPLGSLEEELPPAPPPPPPPPPPPEEPAPVIDLTQKEPIVLNGVQFDYDSAVLRPDSTGILDEAVSALNQAPEVKVVVKGHTCDLGTDLYNVELSEKRAVSVRAYLVERGISGDRLFTQGFGKTMPVADNTSKEGRERNRRVELQVVDEGSCLTPAPGAGMDEKGCAVLKP